MQRSIFPNKQGTPSIIPKPPKGSFEAGTFLTIALFSVLNSDKPLTIPELATIVSLCIVAAVITLRR